jgi:hypothetical protein
MHSSWFRSPFIVAGSTWWRFDGTLWCQKDGGYVGHPFLLAKDEARC